jgi:predicted signal transduction protein with EAL and GGDEF domain
MTDFTSERRVLIIDDQSHIHETFARIFRRERSKTGALEDFEATFLFNDDESSADSKGDQPVFSLAHAYSGEEGLRQVEQSSERGARYSVAFVDMRMPNGMDGLETTQQLWRIDPNLQVVICTAYSDHTWDEILKVLGYNDRLLLLRKPFEQDEARQLALALSEKARLAALQRKELLRLEDEVERRRRAESELRDIAHRDSLTALPNRPYLIEKLEQLLANQGLRRRSIDALLFLDLDNFKIINDSLGHEAGDDLLNQVAVRLKECVRDHDVASRYNDSVRETEESDDSKRGDQTIRLGGDEFVVLLEGLTKRDDALRIARRIVQRICEPFQIGDRLVTVGTSVGVAFLDHSIADAHQVLRNADTAMYQAKNDGKGQIAVFDQTMHDAIMARHELEADLRTALKEERFELRYQPIINLRSGQIQGVEVLTRWPAQDGTCVPPSEFVPVAEEIGLISEFGEWVLENSMREFRSMIESLPDGRSATIHLGVNVSRRQLADPYFFDRLQAIQERVSFRGPLKLEMGEDGDERHAERALETMKKLHTNGVGIHIDDFGKGSSSLRCFQVYPIETVKIDRTFTASITSDVGNAIISQAIIQLAHHLSASIVCQGLESLEQLRLLQQWGCDYGQGYYFAPPLDIKQLRELLLHPERSEGIKSVKDRSQSPLSLPTTPVQTFSPDQTSFTGSS